MNDGYLMEHLVYEYIKKLNIFDEIIYEKELIKRYGRGAEGVDYLLIHQNKMILLQVKWRRTRRRENSGIESFLKSSAICSCFIVSIFLEDLLLFIK